VIMIIIRRVIYLLAAGLFIYTGCTPQQFVVQHAEKGHFSRAYKHLGVYCDRADVHIHGWNNDSISIAVTMDSTIKNNYSFLVDSSGDSLLLIGKHGVVSAAGNSPLPEADIALPYNTGVFVRTEGSIIVDTMRGAIDASATDTILYRCPMFTSPVNLTSSGGSVTVELPGDVSCDVDLECSENAEIRLDSKNFHGEKLKNRVKGTLGAGGALLKITGEKGVIALFDGNE